MKGILGVIAKIRTTSWSVLPYIDYWNVLKAKFPLRSRPPDFPVKLSISEEITKSDVVLELGANIGANTVRLAKVAGYVYSFEPSPKSYNWLRRNTRKFSNVRCYRMAVSEKTRKQDFKMQFEYGSLFNLDGQSWDSKVEVDVVGINDIPFRYNVMIMDCEGAEVPIFKWFKRFDMVDRIYVETHTIDGQSTLPFVKGVLSDHYENVSEDFDPSGHFPWVIARRE